MDGQRIGVLKYGVPAEERTGRTLNRLVMSTVPRKPPSTRKKMMKNHRSESRLPILCKVDHH